MPGPAEAHPDPVVFPPWSTGRPRPAGPRPDPRRSRPSVVAAIAAGGVIGTLGRYGIGTVLVPSPGRFPWATFTANVTGSFALGLVLILLVSRFPPHSHLRPFVATGVLGAYTTFSSLVVEVGRLAGDDHAGLAAAYLVASLGGGLLAAAAGLAVGRRVSAPGGAR